MSADLDGVIERVRRWPEERQQDAAAILLEMERQDASGYRLNDEWVVRGQPDVIVYQLGTPTPDEILVLQ
jgi:hypothetical protein